MADPDPCEDTSVRERWGDDAKSFAHHLIEVETNAELRESFYVCPGSLTFWLEDFPHGEPQRGGSPRLRVIQQPPDWLDVRNYRVDVSAALEEMFARSEADAAAPLTFDAIATLDDEGLDSWLWARVCKVIGGDDDRDGLLALAAPLRMFYLTRSYEYEVGNGGTMQYVSNAVNRHGTQFDLIAEGYELLGMNERANLVRAIAARVRPYEHMLRDDWRGDEPPDDDEEMDRLDEPINDLCDDVRLAYVRAYPPDFAI